MAFRYETMDDAMQQIHQTVLMVKGGTPVYLKYSHGWMYTITDLNTGEKSEKDIREIGLSFEPLELGYVNARHGLIYLSRHPIRMWKQGLSFYNIRALKGRVPDNILRSKAMCDCLINKYPPINKALRLTKDTAQSTAFHRDFAFTVDMFPNITLEYKGIKVGTVNDNRDFEINNKFHYLKEPLQEIINAQN